METVDLEMLSVERVHALGACYGEDRLRQVAKGMEEWTVAQHLACEDVPLHDRFWLIRQDGVIPEPLAKRWADRCLVQGIRTYNVLSDPNLMDAVRAWMFPDEGHATVRSIEIPDYVLGFVSVRYGNPSDRLEEMMKWQLRVLRHLVRANDELRVSFREIEAPPSSPPRDFPEF